MQFMLLLLAFSGYVVIAKCSINELPVHPGVGGLYKGPNSETIIKGPDGSVITAQQEGGSVITQGLSEPIVVPDTLEVEPIQSIEPVISTVTASPVATVTASPIATVTATPVVAAAPVAAAVAPIAAVAPVIPIGHTVEVIQPDPHIIETEIVDAPVIEPQQSSDLVGPSGSISTRGSSSIVSGPASTTISEPAKVIVAAPLVAAVPVISSVTTPLRVIPVVEGDIGLASTPIGPTISTVTVGPPIATVTASPQIVVSSSAPPLGLPTFISTAAPPLGVASTTIAPPLLVSTPGSVQVSNIGASIQPASSYGVINNLDNTISSTPRPDVVLSPTLTPIVKSTQNVGGIVSTTPSTNLDLINNRQLNINPSLIPSANIIPPEIGPLPPGAIDLGSTVTVSTFPRAPGLVSSTESPNIQRLENVNSVLVENTIRNDQQASIRVDGRVDQLTTNQVILAGNGVSRGPPPQRVSVPLLRDSHPIPVGIPRDSIVGSQLANYGIDSSQIDLTNVPLSSVSGIPKTLDQEIDDVSLQLWNRYGRNVEEKKVKPQNGKSKEK